LNLNRISRRFRPLNAHRSEAILVARTKEKFKGWVDFVARKVVLADVAVAIKDSVRALKQHPIRSIRTLQACAYHPGLPGGGS
jgi:hypothetical protein